MPIIVIGDNGGFEFKKPDKKAESKEIKSIKNTAKTHPAPAKKHRLSTEEEEARLIAIQKKNPYNMEINMKLAAFYSSQNNWPEAEHHQEIVEWLDRIKRFVSTR